MNWILPNQRSTPLLEWIFSSRGIVDKNSYFNPTIKDLHDPFLIHDMKKAVTVIEQAVRSNKKIFIHGDFDVDGITATSIMWLFLFNELKADVLPYIPNRFEEGYGLSEESIQNIIAQGGDLIITVDCGVKDISLVNKYKDKINFIITDHHTIRLYSSEEEVEGGKKVGEHYISEDALAVVHPGLEDSYPFHEICGAVVSWKVCSALNDHMGLGVDMENYLDLAALGAVCDIMPLIDENRAIVKVGIDKIRSSPRLGLSALMELANVIPSQVSTYHIGFIIGPRLNASGRLENAIEGVRLLTTNSPHFAAQIAAKLEGLNNERRELTKQFLEEAENKISDMDPQKKVIIVYGENWPEGILGLIAGKLTDKYNRPVIVGSLKDGRIKASARSTPNFNIASVLKRSDKYLLAHGGHAQAAGLSLKQENFIDFDKFILEIADEDLKDSGFTKSLIIDALASPSDLNNNLVSTLLLLEPFGHMNQKPVIAIKNLNLKKHMSLGSEKTHIKLNFNDSNLLNFEAIGFGLAEKFNEEILNSALLSSTPIDIAGSLEFNEWNGNKKISMKLDDFRFSS